MKKVTISYKGAQEFRGIITFEAEKIFKKKEYGFNMIGYLPEGQKRKTWWPVGGKIDDVNDYSETEITIEEI